MKLDNPAAFTGFMTDTVCVLIMPGTRNADTLSFKACVRAGTPDGATVGMSNNCEQWTVTFQDRKWISPRQPSRGMIVEADKMNNRWPKLTVQHVYKLGGLITLECSGNEQGALR